MRAPTVEIRPGTFAAAAPTTRLGGRLIAAPTVETGTSHAKTAVCKIHPRSGAVRAAFEKISVAVTIVRFHCPARSREGVGSMERDSPVERNGLRAAASWDARRAAPGGTGGRSFRHFSAVKSALPEAGEKQLIRTRRPAAKSRLTRGTSPSHFAPAPLQE